MIPFFSDIQKMGNKAEKTGWIYILVPAEIANQIKPNNRKAFKVKGVIDNTTIHDILVIPVVEIGFILPLNTSLRKQLQKMEGDRVNVKIEEMVDVKKISIFLLEKLDKNEKAKLYFNALSVEQQNCFSNWVKSAKANAIIEQRTDAIITACNLKMNYGQMMAEKKSGIIPNK